MRRVLLDLDGVLADFVGGAAKLFMKDVRTATCYGLENCWKIDKSYFWSCLDYDFWINLEPTQEADQIVKMCVEAVGLESIAILSHPCLTKGCSDGKRDWVHRHFPRLFKRILLGGAKHFCASYNSFLVDDTDDQVKSFMDHGGRAFLFPRPWNSGRDRIQDSLEALQSTLNTFVRSGELAEY